MTAVPGGGHIGDTLMLHVLTFTAGHLMPHSLAFLKEARVNCRAEQTQTVRDPKALMVERDLLRGSRIPIPRLPAIFIPALKLAANAGGFLGLRCSTQRCAVLPRSLLAVGFVSLCFGTGQLQMV